MNCQPIPEAAVDAAWDSLLERGRTRTLGIDYAGLAAALEAAAPHMLAGAFEQGQKSGMRHADRLAAAAKIGRPELPGPISPNPYRPAK